MSHGRCPYCGHTLDAKVVQLANDMSEAGKEVDYES